MEKIEKNMNLLAEPLGKYTKKFLSEYDSLSLFIGINKGHDDTLFIYRNQ